MPEAPLTSRLGIAAGRTDRLGLAAVVVGPEVDDVLVEAGRHVHRRAGQSRLGVAHRRRAVVERAEVAVPVDHRQAQGERLRHADQGVVDRRVAVRMQPAHDLADDARALDVPAVGPQAHLRHLEQDAPLHRLQPVAGIRQRPGVDDRVGVLEEGSRASPRRRRRRRSGRARVLRSCGWCGVPWGPLGLASVGPGGEVILSARQRAGADTALRPRRPAAGPPRSPAARGAPRQPHGQEPGREGVTRRPWCRRRRGAARGRRRCRPGHGRGRRGRPP